MYETNQVIVQYKDNALLIAKMCKELFESKSNSSFGIRNFLNRDSEMANKKILSWFDQYPKIKSLLNYKNNQNLINFVMEWNHKLLGCSEYYYSRVCEKIEISYSDKNIDVEDILF